MGVMYWDCNHYTIIMYTNYNIITHVYSICYCLIGKLLAAAAHAWQDTNILSIYVDDSTCTFNNM